MDRREVLSGLSILGGFRHQAIEASEAAPVDAALERVILAGCGCDAEEDAVVSDPLWDVPEFSASTEHEVDGLDEEGLAGVARSPEDVQAGLEVEVRGFLVRTEEPDEPEL